MLKWVGVLVIGWRWVAMVAWWCWVGGGVVLLFFFLLLHFSSTNGLLWPLGKRGSLTSERQKNNKLLLYKATVMYLPYYGNNFENEQYYRRINVSEF